jgi:hypothetical protein
LDHQGGYSVLEIEIQEPRLAFVGDGIKAAIIGRSQSGEEVRLLLPSRALPVLQRELTEMLHQY